MSRESVKRDRRNWKGRLKGRALGAFQLETWHEQCRKERKNWRCYRSPVKSSFDGEKVMAAMDAKPKDRSGRTVEYRGGGLLRNAAISEPVLERWLRRE